MPIVQSNDIEYNEICALVRRLRWFSCFFLSLNLFSFYLCTEKGAKKYDFIEEHYRERDKHERRRKKMRNVILFVNKFDQFFSVGYIIVVDMDSYFSVHHHRSIERRSSIRFQQCGTLQLNLSTNCISI